MNVAELKRRLVVPVIAAPMLLVSGVDLLVASCLSGVVGSLPSLNARTSGIFEQWLVEIDTRLSAARAADPEAIIAPHAINLIVRDAGTPRFVEDLALIERFRPPIVITSVGQPGEVAKRVHDYGGLVFHDVATLRHAEKAIAANVDGLILLTAGAGGHTGVLNPFAFVPQIRRMFGGAILLAGSISDGRGVRAAEMLGADFAYMGTRFAATREAMTSDEYRDLLVGQKTGDVMTTDRISGLSATFLRGSIARVGLDPDNLPERKGLMQPGLPDHLRAWRDIWSAGHGVGMIDDIPSVDELVARLRADYDKADGHL